MEWQPVPADGRAYLDDPDFVYCGTACYLQWFVRYVKVSRRSATAPRATPLRSGLPRLDALALSRLGDDGVAADALPRALGCAGAAASPNVVAAAGCWPCAARVQAHEEVAAKVDKPLLLEEFGLTWWCVRARLPKCCSGPGP